MSHSVRQYVLEALVLGPVEAFAMDGQQGVANFQMKPLRFARMTFSQFSSRSTSSRDMTEAGAGGWGPGTRERRSFQFSVCRFQPEGGRRGPSDSPCRTRWRRRACFSLPPSPFRPPPFFRSWVLGLWSWTVRRAC